MIDSPLGTDYVWPTTGTPGEIWFNAGPKYCMQVDHDDSNHVITALCTGAAYQEWHIVNELDNYIYQWQSEWDKALCLAYDADAADVWVVACGSNDWYELWWGD
jgi:hypothetical protein